MLQRIRDNAKVVEHKGLIVGQAPGSDGKAFGEKSCSVKRLARLLGMTVKEMWMKFDKVNLLDEYPGRCSGGSGDKFGQKEAKAAASRIVLTNRPVVIILGSNVAKAFGLKPMLLQSDGCTLTIPHPSGVNHFWNEPASIAIAAATVRNILRHKGFLQSI